MYRYFCEKSSYVNLATIPNKITVRLFYLSAGACIISHNTQACRSADKIMYAHLYINNMYF